MVVVDVDVVVSLVVVVDVDVVVSVVVVVDVDVVDVDVVVSVVVVADVDVVDVDVVVLCVSLADVNQSESIIANIKQPVSTPNRRPRRNGDVDGGHCIALHGNPRLKDRDIIISFKQIVKFTKLTCL